MAKKKTIDELRGEEIVNLKKELGLSKTDPIAALQIVEGAAGPKGRAKYPNLHKTFEWDNSKAAYEFRLEQARKMLRTVIFVTPEGSRIRTYTSLKSDQALPGGGYRETVSVMKDEDLRRQLLEQAWEDFEYFREKYGHLKEFASVFIAADRAKTEERPAKKSTVRKGGKKCNRTKS